MRVETITQSLRAFLVAAAACAPAALIVSQGLEPAYAEALATKTLTINVSGFKAQTGKVHVGVYAGEEAFNSDQTNIGEVADVASDTVSFTFQTPAGKYGVKVFHDVNGNGELDTNMLGIPNEPWAVSSKKRSFGPPRWSKSNFTMTDDRTVDITF